MRIEYWTDKYSPKTLTDLIGHDNITSQFINMINNDNIPNILLHGGSGVGKCHGYDTPIIMYDGTIKMVQDIIPGDQLMGNDSMSRTVIGLGRGIDEMYEISNVKGDKYIVNSEHLLCLKYSPKPLIVHRDDIKSYKVDWFDNNLIKKISKTFSYKNGNKEMVYKNAQNYINNIMKKYNNEINISVKDYLKLPKTIKNNLRGYKTGITFPTKKIDLDPYLLGVWLGDGTSNKPEITNHDAPIIKYLKTNVSKYNCYLQYCNKYTYRINSIVKKHNIFFRFLKRDNLINNKHIPHNYKCNSRVNQLKLLAGLIDTDGYYNKNSNIYEIVQKNNTLSNDIVFLARSLGFACYSKKCKKSCMYKNEKREGIYNRIVIYGDKLDEIPVLCSRKTARSRKQIKNPLVSGITVKSIGVDKYYGFELDGNHKYLLDNFIVTHNTSCINTLVNEYLKEIQNPNILRIKTISEKNVKNIKQIIGDYIKKKSHHKKIVIIEDIDTLSECTQYPIASLMDFKDVIFLFSCNYMNKIIDIIQSRCILVSLKPLSDSEIITQLVNICKAEDIKYTKTALLSIVSFSDQDIRKAINILQMMYTSYGKITLKNVKLIMTNTLQYFVKKYLVLCFAKKTTKAMELVQKLLLDGYDTSDFFSMATVECQTFKFCDDPMVNQHHRINFIELIGSFYSKLVYGVLTNIQIYSLTYELCKPCHDINDLICKQ
jgi:DNA polymerase III delta prime subunit